MRIAFVGSREYPDRDLVEERVHTEALDAAMHQDTLTIVSGGANGPDRWAVQHATEMGLATKVHLPNWDQFGKRAGPMRNTRIVADCDRVVAFWDGHSAGTLDTIRKAVLAGKKVEIYGPRRNGGPP